MLTAEQIYDIYRFDKPLRQAETDRINSIHYPGAHEKNYTEQRIWDTNDNGTRHRFLPLRLYSFSYVYKNRGLGKDSIDIRPMVLVLEETIDKTKRILKGVNLNYIVESAQIAFLTAYVKFLMPAFEKDLENVSNDFSVFYKFPSKTISDFQDNMYKEMPFLKNAQRNWDIDRIPPGQVRVVSIEDYSKIFCYDGYKASIKGKNWAQVRYETIR